MSALCNENTTRDSKGIKTNKTIIWNKRIYMNEQMTKIDIVNNEKLSLITLFNNVVYLKK
mgnify:CR=1 FL=1